MSSTLHRTLETLRLDEQDHSKKPNKQFKVGLDYGTTYSAGAFCLYSSSNQFLKSGEIKAFCGYASELNETKRQNTEVPSAIRYKDNKVLSIGDSAIKKTRDGGHCIEKAKLGLENRPETAPARAMLMRDLAQLPSDTTITTIISDYLAKLFETFKEQLIQVGYGPGDSIELNCAVPSIWTHRARCRMVDAIRMAAGKAQLSFDAGIRLWPEAEAATEHVLSERPNLKLKEKDVFVVCDAGGGTVDLTTYSVQGSEPLCLKEVVEGSGALCGSTFLDEGFYKLVESRARACLALMENKSEVAIKRQLYLATREFRRAIKPGFSGLISDSYDISFSGMPEDRENGSHEDEMSIESKELLPIFEGVAEKVWAQLQSRLGQARQSGHHAKYVIFTGGLSQSPFMRHYLINKLVEEQATYGRSQRIEPVYAETVDYSVAAGAIRCSLKAREDTRTRRINSTSIGIPFSEQYDRKLTRHNEEGIQKAWNEVDRQYYVKSVICWVLTKGEEQPKEKKMQLFDYVPAEKTGTFDIHVSLYACDHVCPEGYPISYYRTKFQDFYSWEEVTFTLDMSIIRERMKPQGAKRRRQRLPKTSYYPPIPSRRSARLSAKSALVSQDSMHLIDPIGDFDTNNDCTEAGPPQPLPDEANQTLQEDDDGSEKHFRIEYTFTMQFDGLLAKYEFWCKNAQYRKTGSVSLPCYELGGQ